MIRYPFPLLDAIRMNLAYRPDMRYFHRAVLYMGMIVMQQPFHWLELIVHRKKIESHQPIHDPIIILGYWRSGTTFLQRLLCLHPTAGALTQYEALFPLGSSIHAYFFKPLMNGLVRLFRIQHPTHGVSLDMNFPSEEDIAFCAAAYPHTPMWAHVYSRYANCFFDKPLICPPGSPESRQFIRDYAYLVKRLSYFKKNKRLVLKSPCNTAKIPEILAAFPNAKFIYIERNPIDVYFSNMKLLANNRRQWLQFMNQGERIQLFRASYKKIIERYQCTRHLIPKENLLEVKLDELSFEPKKILARITAQFGMSAVDERRVDRFLLEAPPVTTRAYPAQVPPGVMAMFESVKKEPEFQSV